MTELSISTDGCSFAESLCFRGIVVGLRGVLSTAMSNSYVSEKLRRERPGSSSRRREFSRRDGERRSANDRPQNARRGSLDIDHLDLDHLCKFCSRGRTFGLSGAVSRSGCVDWRTHAGGQARPGAAGWRCAEPRCHQSLRIGEQRRSLALGPVPSPQTSSPRTPSSAVIGVRRPA